jgi:hypothetical protein
MSTILKVLMGMLCALLPSSAFNERLFYVLEKFHFKFERKQKRSSFWAIFFTLLSLTGYFIVVHLLLFR